MDNKFHVSLEAARLLKEKGYNNYSIVYDCSVEGDILLNQRPIYGEWAGDKDVYPCPTKAEAIDWLESKGVVVELSYDDKGNLDKALWEYFVYTHDKNRWVDVVVCSWEEYNYYKTRLEAEEAAIIKALELL